MIPKLLVANGTNKQIRLYTEPIPEEFSLKPQAAVEFASKADAENPTFHITIEEDRVEVCKKQAICSPSKRP